jgi:plasmid stability protein
MGHNRVMADVKVRNLPDWLVTSFRKHAENEERSLEEELRMLITAEATRRRAPSLPLDLNHPLRDCIRTLASFRA